MEELILNAEIRSGIGRAKVKDLREKGYTPAVIYKDGKDATAVQVLTGEFLRLMHQHRLESAIVTIKVKGDAKGKKCLMKEVQHDPVHGQVVHVDFNEISLTKAIKVNVPVVTKGEAVGVKQEGGSLENVLWEIEVECLATDIPEEITIDVSELKIGDGIHVRDIKLADNVKVLTDPDSVVIHVVAPMKEEAPAEEVEGEEKKEPEVIKEKKEVPAEGEEGKEAKEGKK